MLARPLCGAAIMGRNLLRTIGLSAFVLVVAVLTYLSYRPRRTEAEGPAKAPLAPAGPSFVIAPYLQYPTRTSITILWETSVAGTSVVRYGVGGLSETKAGLVGVTVHE